MFPQRHFPYPRGSNLQNDPACVIMTLVAQDHIQTSAISRAWADDPSRAAPGWSHHCSQLVEIGHAALLAASSHPKHTSVSRRKQVHSCRFRLDDVLILKRSDSSEILWQFGVDALVKCTVTHAPPH